MKFGCSTVALLLLLVHSVQARVALPATTNASSYNVRSFGAVGDGQTIDTKSIQAAIDKCAADGGGVVTLPTGNQARFVSGTLYLKSNVSLKIEDGATLLGSPKIDDYTTDTDRTQYRGEPYMDRCLIFAKDAVNVSIEGPGTIDGQGKSFPNKADRQRNRPKMLRLLGCSNLHMSNIHLEAPASWTSEWRYCDHIEINDISIHSRSNSNGDGLDFDGCTNVRVRGSTFDTSDDSICLQTSQPDKPCRAIDVSGCHFSSRWAGVRIGLLSRGNFEDVHVSDCVFDTHNDSGLKIQMNEGAEMKNLNFTNLTMKDVPRPVLVTFCQKNAWVDAGDDVAPMKRVSGLTFDHITVNNSKGGKACAFMVTGMPEHPLENITFSNITATFPGGGTEMDGMNVLAELTPENMVNHWPEYSTFKANTPAYGVYARHVKGLTLSNIKIQTSAPDGRPAVVFVDVVDAKVSDCPKADLRR